MKKPIDKKKQMDRLIKKALDRFDSDFRTRKFFGVDIVGSAIDYFKEFIRDNMKESFRIGNKKNEKI